MHEPTYREALGHAWHLASKHKRLWVFGLLAIFLGQFGLANFIGQLVGKVFFADSSWWPATWGAIHIVTGEQLLWFSWLAFIVAAVIMFVVAASVCAQGALIATAVHWYNTRLMLNFHSAWRQGVKHFWRILAANILEKLLLAIILMILVEALALIPGGTIFWFAVQILFIAGGVLAALAVSTVAIFTLGHVLVNNKGFIDALIDAWRLFRAHFLVSVELSIMLLACNAIVFMALWLASFLVLIPSFLLSVTAGFSGLTSLVAVSVVAYVLLFVLVIALLGAIFNAFTTSAWMYLFMHMYHEGLGSRLKHLVGKMLKRQ